MDSVTPSSLKSLSKAHTPYSRQGTINSKTSFELGSQESLDGLGFADEYEGEYNLKIGDVIYLSRQAKMQE